MNAGTSNSAVWVLIATFAGMALNLAACPFQQVSEPNPTQTPASSGGGDSYAPVMSRDGRYVLFASTANNLVTLSNGPLPLLVPPSLNVYLRDRTNGTTTLVSVNMFGTGGGNGDSLPTGISTNGQYALFESSASDLVPGDTNNVANVFVRDVVNGLTALVSASTNGGCGNGASRSSVMTPDGSTVSFASAANNLVAGDTNGIDDVFVRNWQAGVTALVSVGAIATNSSPPQGGSDAPLISEDARYVAFFSTATNLVRGVTKVGGDLYVRDMTLGTTYWASAVARIEATSFLHSSNVTSFNAVLSTNGQYLAYETAIPFTRTGIVLRYNLQSGLTDLVGTNATAPIVGSPQDACSLDISPDGSSVAYVASLNSSATASAIKIWNAASGTNTVVSVGLGGIVSTNSTCDWPRFDASARFVLFSSSATNLVSNSLSGTYHLYVRDLQMGVTTLVDVNTNAVGSGVSPSAVPQFTDAANLVGYHSLNSDLAPNDSNHDYDVFVNNVGILTNELISLHDPALPSHSPNGNSRMTSFCWSSNGAYLAFASEADNLVSGDTNGCLDVFVRDLVGGTNILVSWSTNGGIGDGPSTDPAISADGRYVAFTSLADNLVAGDTNGLQDVFLRNLQTGATLLVSHIAGGNGSAKGASYSPQISANGQAILFRTLAQNLGTATPAAGTENLCFYNVPTGSNYLLTASGVVAGAMTPDGQTVAFAGSTGALCVWNSQAATLTYSNASAMASNVAISPYGTRVAYSTTAGSYAVNLSSGSNVVIGPPFSFSRQGLGFSSDERFLTYTGVLNNTNQVYLYDFAANANLLLSQSSSGTPGNGPSDSPTLSPDGRLVVYRSSAPNLLNSGTNAVPSLLLYDRVYGTTTVLTSGPSGSGTADNFSLTPVFSGDGQTLGFQSWASDLVPGDLNQGSDLFAYPLFYVNVAMQNPGSGPALAWRIIPGLTYRVQFKNSLTDPDWQDAAAAITTAGNQAFFNDPAPAPTRFYRIVAY